MACILALALVPGRSVSKRPADGGAAEFSGGLVPATLAEGRGSYLFVCFGERVSSSTSMIHR